MHGICATLPGISSRPAATLNSATGCHLILFGAMATMGAGMTAIAGPLAALAAGFMGGKLIAGQNKIAGIGGTEAALIGTALGGPVGAVVAGAILKLFGHGPMKFRQQSLQGTVSDAGFDGDITNVFRAKGGLLVGNKHKSVSQDLLPEMQDAFDTAINAFYGSAHNFAENLGLDVKLVDGFTKEIQIKSEKGKELTADAVTAMIAGIGDSIASNLLPTVDTLKKAGETSFQTLTRLSGEFDALSSGAVNLGASVKYANELIKGMSFESRSSLLEMAGGAEILGNITGYFPQHFLTEAERLAPVQERLVEGLTDLGFAANLSNEQYKALVQSLDIPDETRIKLLLLGSALFEVNAALDATNQAAIDAARALDETIQAQAKTNLSNVFAALQRSVEAERRSITDKYNTDLDAVNTHIRNVTDSIGKLKSLSDALGNTVDQLRPLSRDGAKLQILNAINTAKAGGGLPDVADISRALDVLKANNITGVRSSFEFAREQAKTANLIGDLGNLTDSQVTLEERSLKALEAQRDRLDEGFQDELGRLDSLLEQGQREIDTLNGLDTTLLSLATAIEQFNLRAVQGGGAGIVDPLIGGAPVVGGNPAIKDQQIIDYFKTPRTPEEIARDAIKNGVTSQQIIATGRFTQVEADKFFKDNPHIPKFADGGIHRGGLRIVGERGPELERTGPSHITSNSDLKKTLGNDEVVRELRLLRAVVGKSEGPNRKVSKILKGVTQGGTALRTKSATS